MREGGVRGVLYDVEGRLLSFLNNGACRGDVDVRGWGEGRVFLGPFVYWPYHEGASVTLVKVGAAVSVAVVLVEETA